MFAARFVLFLSLMSVSLSEPTDFEFCTCMADVEAAKKSYESLHSAYFDEALVYINELMKTIDDDVAKMNAKPGTNVDYYSKNSYEMAYEVLDLCHLNYLKDRFDPVWMEGEMSDRAVCDYVSTRGPIIAHRIPVNIEMLRTCDLEGLFRKVIYKNWQQAVGEVECS